MVLIQNIVIYSITNMVVVNPNDVAHILNFTVSYKFIEINLAKALAVLAGMVWNFLLYKHIVFRPDNDTKVDLKN